MSEAPKTNHMALLAASNLIGDDCLDVNRSYIKCKAKDPNPHLRLQEGEKVTGCVLKVLRVAESSCGVPFEAYKSCLESNNRRIEKCRTEEASFVKCMQDPPK